MNNTLKDLIKSTIISIGMSLTIFCLVCIAFDVAAGGNFSLEGYSMTKMIIGCIVIGLGYGVPTVVYSKDSLPMPVRILIHMGIGCTVNAVTAFAVGWISGPGALIRGLVIQFAVAFIIWFCFNRFYRTEAMKLNDRIQQMK